MVVWSYSNVGLFFILVYCVVSLCTVYRASFTWWVTIVQLICFIVTMAVYGVATVGGLTTTITAEVYSLHIHAFTEVFYSIISRL